MIWRDLCRKTGKCDANDLVMINTILAVTYRKIWEGWKPVKIVTSLSSYFASDGYTSNLLVVDMEPIDGDFFKFHVKSPLNIHPQSQQYVDVLHKQGLHFTEISNEKFNQALEDAKK